MIISAKDLAIGYEGKPIAKGINFAIEQGDYFCIIGSNGSGKSTLLKTILGLIKPLSGEVLYADSVKKKRIGYLSQQKDDRKIFPATVFEIVLSGCLNQGRWHPFFTKEEKAYAREKMALLGIKDLEKRTFYELSGGQKQRVLLSRALCSTHNLIILDEPVSGLDPIVTEDLYNALEEINKQGVTVVMVSHDVQTSMKFANKILEINDDGAVFYESKEEYENKSKSKREENND
ncbi:MAG: ABC transporter ATP-binding protein [Clostridia bacterium]|nr:ABC transporter ATP-binding protein [Clostridia bacterium]